MTFNKIEFSQLLKKAIGSNRTITDFSNQIEVDRPYISKLLNCKQKNPPSPEVIRRFSSNANNGVTEEDLLIASGYITDPSMHLISQVNAIKNGEYLEDFNDSFKKNIMHKYESLKNVEPTKVPVLDDISSDKIIDFDSNNVIYYEYIIQNGNNKHYYLIANDNSMINSRIHEDDLVLFEQKSSIGLNDIVVVLIENTCYIRRFNKVNNIVMLLSDNPQFDSFSYLNSDFKKANITILGKVIEARTRIK